MAEKMNQWNEMQKETLQEASAYLLRLIPATEGLAEEFKGELQEDSYDLLNMVVDGLNWVIQVYNGTKDVINADTQVIDEQKFDQEIVEFGTAYKNRDPLGIASGLIAGVLPFLNKMKEIADAV